MKRIVSFVLMVAVLVGNMHTSVFAAVENTGTSVTLAQFSGSGTSEDPYIITNQDELRAMEKDPLACYKLGNDIELDGEWVPLFLHMNVFQGVFDGAGHTISGLTVQQPGLSCVGLFAGNDGVIRNLNVITSDVGITALGTQYTSILVAVNSGSVSNCHVSGVIHVQDSHSSSVIGGLIGYNARKAVRESSAKVSINLTTDTASRYYIGGLVGNNETDIEQCFADVDISLQGYYYYSYGDQCIGEFYVGGLCGRQYYPSVTNSAAVGSVSIADAGTISLGGISGVFVTSVGMDVASANSYSAVSYTVSRIKTMKDIYPSFQYFCADNCFYDNQVHPYTGYTDPYIGKSTADMKTKTTFVDAGWDFENVWGISPDINSGYPYLRACQKEERVRYSVVYDANGGENAPAQQLVDIGTECAIAEQEPTREGYDFVGWSTSKTGDAEYFYGDIYAGDDDLTLYAVWSIRKFSVSFVIDETTTIEQNISFGNIATVPDVQPKKQGYTFLGWAVNGEVVDIATYKIKENTDFVAAFKIDTYILSFDAGTGEGAPKSVSAEYGTKITIEDCIPQKEEYRFVGWALTENAEASYFPGSEVILNSNITLYAVWELVQTVPAPTVKIDEVDGGKTVTIEVENGVKVYYTKDGSVPSAESTLYTETILIAEEGNTEIKLIAIKDGCVDSDVVSVVVCLEKLETPVATATGEYKNSVEVVLSALEGSEIYYTLDGTQPDRTSTTYTKPIVLTETTILKAFAVKDGCVDSDVVTYTYEVVPVSAPIVVTSEAREITKTSAKLSGYIENDGNDADVLNKIVYWSKDNVSMIYTIEVGSDFEIEIASLVPDTTYYFYAHSENSAGVGMGEILSFTTLPTDKPQSVSISPAYVSVAVGETYVLVANVLPITAENRNVIWATSDSSVATVDKNGRVVAIKNGTAVITATTEVGRIEAACTVQVTNRMLNGYFDFSEWNMATNVSGYADNGFDFDAAVRGGNFVIGTAYLARWDGAVLEKNDPYPTTYRNSSAALYREVDADYHVQEVLWLPKRESALDNDEIKNAVFRYGAVYASLEVNWDCFDTEKVNYYYPEEYTLLNGGHSVAVIGWDDHYAASNFKHTPPGDGAFICKSSWGSEDGEDGIIYVSYYDKYFGKRDGNAVVTAIERNTNFNTIYQYDYYGPTGALEGENGGAHYAANIFPRQGETLENEEVLKAVSFYTYSKNTHYHIYVVEDYQDASSLRKLDSHVAHGTIEDMGYHTIRLDEDVVLEAGTRFAIVIKFSVPGNSMRIYIECPIEGYSSKARANADESYFSKNGTYWTDLTSEYENANFCIKAFTDNGQAESSPRLFAAIDENTAQYDSDKVYAVEEVASEGIEINSAYIQDMCVKEGAKINLLAEDSENYVGGNVSSIITIDENTVSFVGGAKLPEKYDLRDENCVTEVKNQGYWATCWAFSMYASLESCLLKAARNYNVGTMDSVATDGLAVLNEYGVAVSEIELAKTELSMALGSSYQIMHTIAPVDASNKNVTYKSTNDAVVVVDENGTVHAKELGNATVLVTTEDGGYTATLSITVVEGSEVDSVCIPYEEVQRKVSEVFLLDYDVTPDSAANKKVYWSSDKPDVVSVNENGVVTCLKEGEAIITVLTENGEKTDSVKISVEDNLDCRISAISIESDCVVANVKNRKTQDMNVIIVIAAYNEKGQMLDVLLTPKQLVSGENSVNIPGTFDKDVEEKIAYFKGFVILNDATMEPVSTVHQENM